MEAITATAPTHAQLSWLDNGFCTQVTGYVSERDLLILDQATSIRFTFDTTTTATASVVSGDRTWTQRYVKQRTTIPACDWLVQ